MTFLSFIQFFFFLIPSHKILKICHRFLLKVLSTQATPTLRIRTMLRKKPVFFSSPITYFPRFHPSRNGYYYLCYGRGSVRFVNVHVVGSTEKRPSGAVVRSWLMENGRPAQKRFLNDQNRVISRLPVTSPSDWFPAVVGAVRVGH